MVSFLSCSKARTMYLLPSFTTPIHEHGTLILPSPATSPSFIFAAYSSTVQMLLGPIARCVRLLRAHISCSAGRVFRRRRPFFTAHLLSSGLWFHCHTRPNGLPLRPPLPSKSSLRQYGACGSAALSPAGMSMSGFSHVRGARPRLPGSPTMGHPSVHVTGANVTVRPTEWKSIISSAYQSPFCVCTMPPWCMLPAATAFESVLAIDIALPSGTMRPFHFVRPTGKYPNVSSAVMVHCSYGP